MDLHMNYIFWKFEAGKVHEYGVIWRPPFSASMAYKPQILIWIWFCTFNGYLKIFAIQPWRTDTKILTSAFATSAILVSYASLCLLKGERPIFSERLLTISLVLLKIYLFCKFEECEPRTHEIRGDLRLIQPRSHNFMALGQIGLKISGNAYFDV